MITSFSGGATMPITINGAEFHLPADPRVSLLDFIRDALHSWSCTTAVR